MRTSAGGNGRLGHPDARRDHPRSRRRRHRLRHDRRPHPVHEERPSRVATSPSFGSRSNAPSRCRPADTTARSSRPPSRASPSSSSSPRTTASTPASYAGNWRLQLGTLGSGNHFIEVSVDELDRVWLFLHSGSRGVGNKIAMKHISIAQRLCKQWWIDLPTPDLAYLVEGTEEFTRYIRELRWAQHFALLNREEMMDRVIRQVSEFLGTPGRRAGAHQLPPQLHRVGEALRQAGMGVPGRARSRRTPVVRDSSPDRWAPRPTWSKGSATRSH